MLWGTMTFNCRFVRTGGGVDRRAKTAVDGRRTDGGPMTSWFSEQVETPLLLPLPGHGSWRRHRLSRSGRYRADDGLGEGSKLRRDR